MAPRGGANALWLYRSRANAKMRSGSSRQASETGPAPVSFQSFESNTRLGSGIEDSGHETRLGLSTATCG